MVPLQCDQMASPLKINEMVEHALAIGASINVIPQSDDRVLSLNVDCGDDRLQRQRTAVDIANNDGAWGSRHCSWGGGNLRVYWNLGIYRPCFTNKPYYSTMPLINRPFVLVDLVFICTSDLHVANPKVARWSQRGFDSQSFRPCRLNPVGNAPSFLAPLELS